MSQRTFLELTHNPFTPPRDGFYVGADRKTHLEHIRHLSQWSRRVLLVTGPFGIGKSTLYRELSGSLEANTKGARLSGSVTTSEREVLLGLAQGFGVAMDQDLHVDDALQILQRSAAEDDANGRTSIVMVDDAQLLDFAAVNMLIKLVQISPMRLVLFAEATLIANVTRAARQHDLEWFEIRLAGFPAPDVRDYLEWRFTQANYRGRLPFTDAQVERITQRSGGNPNVIDFMANELLADLETGDYRNQSVFPKRHIVLASVLVLLVALLYQLYQQPERPEVVELVNLSPPPADAAQTASDETTTPATTDQPQAAQTRPAEAAQPVVQTPAPATAQPEAQTSPPVTAQPSATTQSSDRTQPSATTQPSAAAQPPATVQRSVAAQPSVAEQQPAATAKPSVTTQQTNQAQPEPTDKQPAEKPVTQTRPAPKPAVTRVSPAQPAVQPQPVPAGMKGGDWLLTQNPQYYTLQLLTLSRRQGGLDFIARQADADEFAMYTTQRGDKQLYVVTYGVFSTRGAADRASRNLQGELKDIKPWIRQLAEVQKVIKGT